MQQFEYCAIRRKQTTGVVLSEEHFAHSTCSATLRRDWPGLNRRLHLEKLSAAAAPSPSPSVASPDLNSEHSYSASGSTLLVHVDSPEFAFSSPSPSPARYSLTDAELMQWPEEEEEEVPLLRVSVPFESSSSLPSGLSAAHVPNRADVVHPWPPPQPIAPPRPQPIAPPRHEPAPAPASTTHWLGWPLNERDTCALCLFVATFVGFALLFLMIYTIRKNTANASGTNNCASLCCLSTV